MGKIETLWEDALALCGAEVGFRASIAGIQWNFYSSCAWTLSLLQQLFTHHAMISSSQPLPQPLPTHNIAIIEGGDSEAFPRPHNVPFWSGKLTDGTPVRLSIVSEHERHLQVGAEVSIITDGAKGHTVCRITESPVDQAFSRRPRPDGYMLPLLQLILSAYHVYVLHASAVAFHKQAVCFLGPSGVGKTTISLALARRGLAFMGDDLIAVARRNAEVEAHALLFHQKVEKAPGAVKEIVDCVTAEGLSVRHSAEVGSTIFLQRTPNPPYGFVRAPQIRVLQWLLHQANDVRLMWYPQNWIEVAAALADSVPGWTWNPPLPEQIDVACIKRVM